MALSARNHIEGKITKIRKGDAAATVELDAGGQRLVAAITAEAVEELGLTEGQTVAAVIKASDVMIESR